MALLMPNDQNFNLLDLHAVEQLIRKAREEGGSTAFGCWWPVLWVALDACDDGQELSEELIAKTLRCAFVVAPCVVEVLLDQRVINYFHRLRL